MWSALKTRNETFKLENEGGMSSGGSVVVLPDITLPCCARLSGGNSCRRERLVCQENNSVWKWTKAILLQNQKTLRKKTMSQARAHRRRTSYLGNINTYSNFSPDLCISWAWSSSSVVLRSSET